jgi:hypothetical protein
MSAGRRKCGPEDADMMASSTCDILLELVRATSAGDPHAFVLREQEYVRRLEGGAARSAIFAWGEDVLGRLGSLQRERPDPAAAAWLGEALRAFLDPLGWIRDEERIQEALDAGRPVRIALRFGAAELFALPWELIPLGATGRPLASLPGCLIRYEWPATTAARPRAAPRGGGRVLFAWSAAGGHVPAAKHLAAIQRACEEGGREFDAARDVVPHVSLGRLREALRAAPVAVLHLLCHGARVDSSSESYGLALDSDDAQAGHGIDARALQIALDDHAASLEVVVLCACHGSNPGAFDGRLGSVAQALHRAGIRAVVGSRYPLGADASVEMTEALYRRLMQQPGSIEEAFLSARERLLERPQRMDWASLQLYARAPEDHARRPAPAARDSMKDDAVPGGHTMNRSTKEASSAALDLGTLATAELRILARELLQQASASVTREATWELRAEVGGRPLVISVRANVARDRGVLRGVEHALEMMDALDDRIRFLEMQQMGPAGLAFDFGREARSRRAELEREAVSLREALMLLIQEIRAGGQP